MIQPKKIAAAKFKATCLALLDEVQTSGQEVIVTKYGKPVAKLVSIEPKDIDVFNRLKGTVTYNEDIVKPLGKEVWGDLQ